MNYRIHFNTGSGDFWVDGDLEDAKSAADEAAVYTQQPIIIEDEDGDEVCHRSWYGVEADEEEVDVIRFGTAGHYGEWSE